MRRLWKYVHLRAGWLLVAATLLACLALAPQILVVQAAPGEPGLRPLRVRAQPVPLGARHLGVLGFRGALVLASDDPAFGGLSALAARPDGQMLALNDAGQWFAFRVPTGRLATEDWWARGLGDAPLPKSERDTEALSWQPATGTATISLEQNHRLLPVRLPQAGDSRALLAGVQLGAPEYLTATMAWGLNSGGEAMTLLPGGQRVVVAEVNRLADDSCDALLTVAGRTRRFGMACLAGFSPTDAVALDATRIIVLHRRFTLAERASALTLVDLAPVLAGSGRAPMQLLARWGPPLLWDNFEGLALRQVDGETRLYLLSDNNFSPAQHSILMVLALPPALASTRNAGRP